MVIVFAPSQRPVNASQTPLEPRLEWSKGFGRARHIWKTRVLPWAATPSPSRLAKTVAPDRCRVPRARLTPDPAELLGGLTQCRELPERTDVQIPLDTYKPIQLSSSRVTSGHTTVPRQASLLPPLARTKRAGTLSGSFFAEGVTLKPRAR
jgi:hypothetical protein